MKMTGINFKMTGISFEMTGIIFEMTGIISKITKKVRSRVGHIIKISLVRSYAMSLDT